MTDLADFEAPERESFRCDSDEKAAWAMRKLHAARQLIAERTERAVAETERIERWLAAETKTAQGDAEFFEAMLADYGRQRRVTDGTKTIVLPHGKIATRPKAEAWSFGEPFVEWAQTSAPELVRTKSTADASAAKKALTWTGEHAVTADGEPVPGVTVTFPAEDDYSVTVTVDGTDD